MTTSVITATGIYGDSDALTAAWMRDAVGSFDKVVREARGRASSVLVVANGGSWGHAVPLVWWHLRHRREDVNVHLEMHTCDPAQIDGKRLRTSLRMMRQRCATTDPELARACDAVPDGASVHLHRTFRERDVAVAGMLRSSLDAVCVFAADTAARTTARPDRYYRVHETKGDMVRSHWFVPMTATPAAAATAGGAAPAAAAAAATEVIPRRRAPAKQTTTTTAAASRRHGSLEHDYWVT
jgi:hypothetical protein